MLLCWATCFCETYKLTFSLDVHKERTTLSSLFFLRNDTSYLIISVWWHQHATSAVQQSIKAIAKKSKLWYICDTLAWCKSNKISRILLVCMHIKSMHATINHRPLALRELMVSLSAKTGIPLCKHIKIQKFRQNSSLINANQRIRVGVTLHEGHHYI